MKSTTGFADGGLELSEDGVVGELRCLMPDELDVILKKLEVEYLDAGAGGSKIEQIMQAVRKGAYASFNLRILGDLSVSLSALARETTTQRANDYWKGVRGVIDVRTSTLCLFGGAGAGTGFHVDWSQARNKGVAVRVSGSPFGNVCLAML